MKGLGGAVRRGWVLILALLNAGCVVGPNYSRPAVPLEKNWQPTRSAAMLEPRDVRWWRRLQDPQLVKCIGMGISGNQNLKEAEARVREARALRGVAVGALLPRADLGALFSRSHTSENAGLISQLPQKNLINFNQNLYQLGFDASWEIDIFGGNRRAVEAASARAAAGIDNCRDVMLTVISEIARNYVELRGAQKQLAVAEKNERIERKTLQLVTVKFDAKRASNLDVERARAQFERTGATIPPLKASIRESVYRIAVLTGRPPDALLNELLATAPIPNPPDIVPVGLPSDLLLRRPDLRRAQDDLHAATADIGVATADLFPRFFLTGQATPQAAKFSDLFRQSSLMWSFGPTIQWPVFHGGQIRSNIRATEARRDEALARYRQAVLTAMQDVETSLVRYGEHQVERERLARSFHSQKRAVDLANERYAQGLSDLLTVLDAQRQLAEIENSLAVSQTQVMDNLISLYKALGGGWEEVAP
jgi:NodT family efflux transporter outer membrane factor (OMF) lipoprotein